MLSLVANYNLLQNTQLYVTVDNLTNEAYENKAHPADGPGSYPQAARSYVGGINQKF